MSFLFGSHFECTFLFHFPVLCQSMYGFRIYFFNESVQLESFSLLFYSGYYMYVRQPSAGQSGQESCQTDRGAELQGSVSLSSIRIKEFGKNFS